LPFSCRKRHNEPSESNDLERAAVGWNGGLGGLATHARLPQWHARTTRHDGRSVEPHAAPNHASTTDAEKESRSTQRAVGTGGHDACMLHDQPSYHHSTTGMRFCDAVNTKSGVPTTLPQPPNGGVQLPRAHCNNRQKANDLAREAVSWNALFGGGLPYLSFNRATSKGWKSET
jgi:hypothetical protein